jgi:transposase
MFPIVAEKYKFIIGIDTHARKHVSTIINNLGVVIARRGFRVTACDINKFIDWVLKVAGVDNEKILFAIEGTSSYGETLTQELLKRKLEVMEVKPPKTKSRGGDGKTDQIDSELAALNILRLPVNKLIKPRLGEKRKTLRVILGSRRMLIAQQTMNKNALIALLRSETVGVDARKPLTPADYCTIARWKLKDTDNHYEIKQEAGRMAKAVVALAEELASNKQRLYDIVSAMAPDLLNETGVGPVTLATVLCAYSHKGRVRSAEAFASLAGTTPIPASSGNTNHFRLNHYGDRQLNHALNVIALIRMRIDETTKEYVKKRLEQGLSQRDIRRSLKRYIARSLYRKLEACNISATI